MGTDYTNKRRLVTKPKYFRSHFRPQTASDCFLDCLTHPKKLSNQIPTKSRLTHCGSIKTHFTHNYTGAWTHGLYSDCIQVTEFKIKTFLTRFKYWVVFKSDHVWFQSSPFQTSPSDLTWTMLNLSIFRLLCDALQSVKCFANYLGGLACCF